MERFGELFRLFKDKEPKLDVSITPEASINLKRLMQRPNPDLVEFAFLGLGKENRIDQILVADENRLISYSKLDKRGIPQPRVSHEELVLLFARLGEIDREDDFFMLGHTHPAGVKEIGDLYFLIKPSEILLDPSMGNKENGGPSSGHDVGFLKWFYQNIVNVPCAGIAASTGNGLNKLRIYKTQELINIKRYNDIDKVPQTTITL